MQLESLRSDVVGAEAFLIHLHDQVEYFDPVLQVLSRRRIQLVLPRESDQTEAVHPTAVFVRFPEHARQRSRPLLGLVSAALCSALIQISVFLNLFAGSDLRKGYVLVYFLFILDAVGDRNVLVLEIKVEELIVVIR